MTHDKILADLATIVGLVLDNPGVVLTRETTATDVPDWDSMAHITIIVESERHFTIKVRTAEIEDLHNVGDFVDLIAAKCGIARAHA
jgi:acyl carrier protein